MEQGHHLSHVYSKIRALTLTIQLFKILHPVVYKIHLKNKQTHISSVKARITSNIEVGLISVVWELLIKRFHYNWTFTLGRGLDFRSENLRDSLRCKKGSAH